MLLGGYTDVRSHCLDWTRLSNHVTEEGKQGFTPQFELGFVVHDLKGLFGGDGGAIGTIGGESIVHVGERSRVSSRLGLQTGQTQWVFILLPYGRSSGIA